MRSSDGATNICPPSVSESDSESKSSDSEDCDPRNITNLRYFTSKTFTSARHQWLMIPALKGWRACIDSFSQDSKLRKYIAEYDAPMTNENVTSLTKSKPYLEGTSIIELAEAGATISRRQFTTVRDYLLCRLTLATGTCPGALNNVLLSDYETSRVNEGNQIILVPNHKRTKDGPAMLGMDPLMQRNVHV